MAPCRATLTTGPRITVAPGDGGGAPRREAARRQQRKLTGKVCSRLQPSAAHCYSPAQALVHLFRFCQTAAYGQKPAGCHSSMEFLGL